MSTSEKKGKIKILKDGPYFVTGNVHLSEKIIISKGKENKFIDGQEFPENEEYALCRCGKSKNAPFCDGSHVKIDFNGNEVALRSKYEDRAESLKGPNLDLLDDNRCAFARFCHRNEGNVWELTEHSDKQGYREEAIKGASNCPSGRLVAMDKTGKPIEHEYEQSIEIIQDPEKKASGGIFVKGNIPIESSDGHMYEIRNRVVLCRCGESSDKPFCDAKHIQVKFSDKYK